MALYRCAACGSPNVVTDTQIGGLKYDYLKGAVGTAILGAGGAAAGIKNQQQQVFKCPDCGMTLSYAMPEEIKQVIDLGVMSLNARAHLKLRGSPIEWEYLTSKFKNIEFGGADELAMELKQQKDLKEKHGMELLRSKGTATQEEFDAAIDYLRLFAHRMGYDRSIYAPAPPEEYTPATPTSLADYAAYCSALDIFIENFFRYLQLSKEESTYRGLHFPLAFKEYLYAYICNKYTALTGDYISYAPYFFESETCGMMIVADPFLYELIRTSEKTSAAYRWEKNKEFYEEYNTKWITKYIIRTISAQHYEYVDGAFIPKLREKDGILYYWDKSFLTSPLQYPEHTPRDCTRFEENQIYPSVIAEEAAQEIVENYFMYYPEKREKFNAQVAEYYKKAKQRTKQTDELKACKDKIETISQSIGAANEKIASLERKIFGKKKAAEQIEALKQTIAEQEKQKQAMKAEADRLNKEISSFESEEAFGWRMRKEWDYFIAWHPVQ